MIAVPGNSTVSSDMFSLFIQFSRILIRAQVIAEVVLPTELSAGVNHFYSMSTGSEDRLISLVCYKLFFL